MLVDIFVPCFIDQLKPETAMNMVKILERFGCEVHYNMDQTCCGQPAYNSGYQKEARNIAKKFLHDFNKERYVVAPSGSCIGYIRNYYKKLFKDTPEFEKAKKLPPYLFEFSEFLIQVLNVQNIPAYFPHKATYHDGCGSLRECGVKQQPRQLLSAVEGLELIEMKECETCCGFGGTFAVKYEPISTGMAYTKIHSAIATGAEYIISGDFSCLMHLDAYIAKHQLPIKTIHLADVLVCNKV